MNSETAFTPLAIVGVGCLFPKAAGPGFYWANVKNGVDCIEPIPTTHWNPDEYFDADPKSPDMTYARRGGFLSPIDFNPMEFGVSPRDIEATDTSQLLGLVAAKQALTDAGVDFNVTDRNRVSVILGVTGTLELVIPLGARLGHPKWKKAMKDAGIPVATAEDASQRIAESYVPWQENSFPGLLGNVVAGRIANKLDLGGTNCVVDAACASSLSAVHLASLELQAGRADVVVTGGIDTFNDIFMYMCFSKTPALSPTGDAKPFDSNGDGTILGEGLGVVVLKRLADADREGDTIYAVLKSVGSSSDGKGNAIYAPSPEGQKKAILNAYRLADVTPDTIELVEAHGTGTKVGDTAEITALTEVYSANAKPERPWVTLGSVKSMIGHTKAAAGAASLIKVALALHNKVLPPTLKVTQPVEPLRIDDTPFSANAKMRPWLPRAEHPRRAAMSAFGFGGSNFHAVLEEYRPAKSEADWDGSVEIVALSADSPERIEQELAQVPTTEWAAFGRFAEESRSRFRHDARYRVAFAVQRGSDLVKAVKEAKIATGPAAGKVAVLFPGQGSQSVGMLRELSCLFPEMLDELARANEAVPRLSDIIYPPTRFDAAKLKADDDALRDTRRAQPAIGAVSFGAWRVLHERFGLNADAFAGHSYGELVALAAAGLLTPTDLFKLSRTRGELMAAERGGDPGSMLAVLAPLPDIEAAIRKHDLKLVVANKNAPKQTVLSGSTAEVERAQAAFRDEKIKSSRLQVAAAFHSEFVADAAGPLRTALESVNFHPSLVPVYANTTADIYPADATAAKDLLANQLAKPVAFVEQILAMAAAGVRTFLEVGPGSVLTGLVEKILADAGIADAEVFATDGKRSSVLDLGNALARLAARGVAVKLPEWEAGSRCRPAPPLAKAGLTVALSGANYVTPREPRPPSPPISIAATTRMVPLMSDSKSDPNAIAQALAMTQQSLAALQRMQEQTAQLHRQFLESQESSQRTLQSLVDQQQALLMGGLGAGIALPPPVAYVPPPKPAYVPPPPAALQPVPVSRPTPVAIQTPVAPAPVREPAKESGGATIATTLLAVVSEKTGYPVSSLDLSLSLDADLGVDSIKRVEILSTLQEKLPDAPPVKPEHLGSLHTLQDVANFLSNGSSPNGVHPEEDAARTQPISREQMNVLRREALGESVDVAGPLLAVVAEKTGYPVASLDLKLSLDSDLGVDSIKRVEILSALQEKLPHAPQVKPEHLGTLHTLQDVADFLRGAGPRPEAPATDRFAAESLAEVPTLSDLTAPDTEHVSSLRPTKTTDSKLHSPREGSVSLAAVRVPGSSESGSSRSSGNLIGTERIDRSILQVVDLDPHSPRSRIPLAAGSEVWVVGEADGLAERVSNHLAKAGLNARVMSWSGPGTNKPSGALAGLVLIAPVAGNPDLNAQAFSWLQQVAPKLRQAGRHGTAVLVTISRLDGAFGLNTLSEDADPVSGGLAGLLKTARHEWPEVTCKAIDLDAGFSNLDAAAAAAAEEVLTSGPIEVGIGATHRVALEPARTVRRLGAQSINLGPKDVILITGGARGVTAEASAALAEAFGSTMILTGRTPAPGAEPEWLAGLNSESELKKAIAEKLGADAGPRQIGEQYQKIAAQREIRRTLKRIQAGGAKAAYFAVDAANGRAVADLLHQVRVKFGPVTALVHGAGVLADRRIEDLTADDFNRVYSTKVDGLRNLLDLLGQEDLKALVLFSSVTARLGRTGQLAYAAANEVLNKTAQIESRRRPGCRVVSINWGPWDGGMVTPSLRKQFESEGVGMVPLLEGGLFLVHELSASGRAVEVMALGKPKPSGTAGSGVVGTPPPRPSGSGVTAMPAGAVAELAPVFERTIDIESHPILRSHVLDGRAVLPIALHLEFLAHAALHGHPGLVFHGFNDLRITQAVKLEADETQTLKAYAGKSVKQDKHFVVPVELRGRQKGGREMLKSRAEIILVASLPNAPAADRPPTAPPCPCDVATAYREHLFHGPDLHGLESVRGVSDLAVLGTAVPAGSPADWFQYPLRSSWIADPMIVDCSFQLMCLWSKLQHEAGSVPNFVGRYRQYRRHFPDGPVSLVVRITRDNGTFARADIDYLDAAGQVVAQVQDYECVIEQSMNQAYRRNQLGMVKA